MQPMCSAGLQYHFEHSNNRDNLPKQDALLLKEATINAI